MQKLPGELSDCAQSWNPALETLSAYAPLTRFLQKNIMDFEILLKVFLEGSTAF